MSHPDLDRLTAWVHGLLEPEEAEGVRGHVAACGDCRETADEVGEEAQLLAREILSPIRAEALKEKILSAAGGRRARWRGLLWQIPSAAAVLLGLLALLFSRGSKHHLEDGRVSLEDGSVVVAPRDFESSRSWQMRALESARVRLSDRSTVELGQGTWFALGPEGPRGVRPTVSSGQATFVVSREVIPLTIDVPAGQVETADGTVSVKFVVHEKGEEPMNKALAGALITVVAGSASMSTPGGIAEARAGQSAILAPAEAPLFVTAPQDKQEDLLRRLEELVARVAKLETEVAQLEAKNKQLKIQLQANAPGGPGGAVWVIQEEGVQKNPTPGGQVERTLRVQLNELNEAVEKNEKKPEQKKAPSEK